MASDRVLSTATARTGIGQIRSLIDNGLAEQIRQLNNQGQILSDPENWDGPLANEFRSATWPQTKSALDKAQQELGVLQQSLDKIAQNIFSAGGGS